MTTAKAKATAQQAVIVHVHTAPPKRARRRATKRQQGVRAQQVSVSGPSAFNIPSQNPGRFYVHASGAQGPLGALHNVVPMPQGANAIMPQIPRLAAENIQVGRLGQAEAPQVPQAQAPLAAESTLRRADNPIRPPPHTEPATPIRVSFTPEVRNESFPDRSLRPSLHWPLESVVEFPSLRRPSTPAPYRAPSPPPTPRVEILGRRLGDSEIEEAPDSHISVPPTLPLQHITPGSLSQRPDPEAEASQEGEPAMPDPVPVPEQEVAPEQGALATEAITHRPPVVNEQLAGPIGTLRSRFHNTRSAGPTGLVPGLVVANPVAEDPPVVEAPAAQESDPAREVFKGPFTQKSLQSALEKGTASQKEIVDWFATSNGENFLRRARGIKIRGGMGPLIPGLADAILEAYNGNVGGPAGAA